ncbi:hypothetical protein DFH09DRAFT_1105769 [Mycena vulgaris]|nr:hypothetical protein DFH09DRAFT_1105769 [Mycena vulgaris]
MTGSSAHREGHNSTDSIPMQKGGFQEGNTGKINSVYGAAPAWQFEISIGARTVQRRKYGRPTLPDLPIPTVEKPMQTLNHCILALIKGARAPWDLSRLFRREFGTQAAVMDVWFVRYGEAWMRAGRKRNSWADRRRAATSSREQPRAGTPSSGGRRGGANGDGGGGGKPSPLRCRDRAHAVVLPSRSIANKLIVCSGRGGMDKYLDVGLESTDIADALEEGERAAFEECGDGCAVGEGVAEAGFAEVRDFELEAARRGSKIDAVKCSLSLPGHHLGRVDVQIGKHAGLEGLEIRILGVGDGGDQDVCQAHRGCVVNGGERQGKDKNREQDLVRGAGSRGNGS